MAWTRLLRDVTLEDVGSVGGKNASLGEMLRELVPLGVRVPDGFAVTADAFRALMRESRMDTFVKGQLASLAPGNMARRRRTSRCARRRQPRISRTRASRVSRRAISTCAEPPSSSKRFATP